jgi:hypothetical protein
MVKLALFVHQTDEEVLTVTREPQNRKARTKCHCHPGRSLRYLFMIFQCMVHGTGADDVEQCGPTEHNDGDLVKF